MNLTTCVSSSRLIFSMSGMAIRSDCRSAPRLTDARHGPPGSLGELMILTSVPSSFSSIMRFLSMMVVASFSATSFDSFASGAEKPLTKTELKAVAKYDDIPVAWREKCVEEWKSVYKAAKGKDKKKLLENDPPYFRELMETDARGNSSIKRTSWGHLDQWDPLNKRPGGILVFQVVNKNRAILKFGDDLFFMDGVDTSDMTDDKTFIFKGLFFVSGTDTYRTVNGASNTVFVVKPIREKQADPEKVTAMKVGVAPATGDIWVEGHWRTNKSGTKSFVKGHWRKR